MIHAFLVSGLIYVHFTDSVELSVIAVVGGGIYMIVILAFLTSWSGGVRYYCRECRTDTKIETNVAIGEYETRPNENIAQGQKSKRQHWKTLKRVGAVCSIIALVVTVILYLMNSHL